MKLVIGVCGLPAAGKSTFIKFCERFLSKHGLSSKCFKMSYALFHYYRSKFKELFNIEKYEDATREAMQKIGDIARTELGNTAVAILTHRLIEESVRNEQPVDVIFIDGVRDYGEVAYFAQKFGSAFFLVAIEADFNVRAKRVMKRFEGKKDLIDLEKFKKDDVWEEEKYKRTLMAARRYLKNPQRFFIIRNNGTKKEFETASHEVLRKIFSIAEGSHP